MRTDLPEALSWAAESWPAKTVVVAVPLVSGSAGVAAVPLALAGA